MQDFRVTLCLVCREGKFARGCCLFFFSCTIPIDTPILKEPVSKEFAKTGKMYIRDDVPVNREFVSAHQAFCASPKRETYIKV